MEFLLLPQAAPLADWYFRPHTVASQTSDTLEKVVPTMVQVTSTLRRCTAASSQPASKGAAVLKHVVSWATFATGPLEKTAFNDMHRDMKGKMVPFPGYELPVLYEIKNEGVMNETLHCHAPGKASVFDVIHMGQLEWTGKDAGDFIEKCVVGDIKELKLEKDGWRS